MNRPNLLANVLFLAFLTIKASCQNVTLANHNSTILSICFSQDQANGNRYLISGSSDDKINFWSQTSNSSWSLTGQVNNVFNVNSLVSIPNGQFAVSSDKNVKIWSLSTKSLVKTFTGHLTLVYQLAISPNQQMLASASTDNTSKVWDISSGLSLSTMHGHTNFVRAVVFYSNEILVTGRLHILLSKSYPIVTFRLVLAKKDNNYVLLRVVILQYYLDTIN
jgi:WD40 repeat protein